MSGPGSKTEVSARQGHVFGLPHQAFMSMPLAKMLAYRPQERGEADKPHCGIACTDIGRHTSVTEVFNRL